MHWSEVAAIFSCSSVVVIVISWFANTFWEKKWGHKSQDLIINQNKNNEELKHLFEKLNTTLTELKVSFNYIRDDVRENKRKIEEHDDVLQELQIKVKGNRKDD